MLSAIRSSTASRGNNFPETLGTDQTPWRALAQGTYGLVPFVIIDASNLRYVSVGHHLIVFLPRRVMVNCVRLVKRSRAVRGRNPTRDNQAEDAPMASRAPGGEHFLPGAAFSFHRTSESCLLKSPAGRRGGGRAARLVGLCRRPAAMPQSYAQSWHAGHHGNLRVFAVLRLNAIVNRFSRLVPTHPSPRRLAEHFSHAAGALSA